MKSRRERRAEARKNKVKFEPQYKSSKRRTPMETVKKEDGTFELLGGEIITLGGKPKTYEEAYGVGKERFNNKFVTIKEVKESE